MGRLLGYHADEQELDRPDLNKCPDCGCYFPQDNCPLCGTECPEHMRAGNRAAVKPAKRKYNGPTNRVVFINWYHSWWFIALMMLWAPIIGIILLITSPHSKKAKITFTAVGVLICIVSTLSFSGIMGRLTSIWEKPVDTSMTREEYISACASVAPEDYYRNSDAYRDKFVSIELKIVSKATDDEALYNGSKYATYYICKDADGGEFVILIRNCLVDAQLNFIPGDVITVYGEGDEIKTVYDDATYDSHTAPCVNMAYFVRGE